MQSEVLQNTLKINELKLSAKKIIGDIAETVRSIDPMHSMLDECQYIQEGLEQEEMVISVVGEFSRGKSCFLNSLLGEKVLKEDAQQTTAAITKLKYGDKPKMIVKFKDGSEKAFPENDNENIDGSEFPRYLRDYTSELSNIYNESMGKVSELIKEVTCEYPNKILKNGITIVDTPGVSGLIPGHTEMTNEQIRKSNAAICLFSCDQVGANQGEIDFLKFVKKELGGNPNKLLYLANKMYRAEEAIKNGESEDRTTFVEQKNHYVDLFKNTIQKHIGINRDDINIFGYDSKWSIDKEESLKSKGGYYEVTNYIDQVLTSDEQIIESHLKDPLQRTKKLKEHAKEIVEKRLEQINNPQDIELIDKNIEDFKEKEEALKVQMESKVNNLISNLKQVETSLNKRFEEEIMSEIKDFKKDSLNNIISSIKDKNTCDLAIKQINNFEEQIKDTIDDFINKSFKKEIENKVKEYGESIFDDISQVSYFKHEEIESLIEQVSNDLKIENQIDLQAFAEYEIQVSSFQNKIQQVEEDINKLELEKAKDSAKEKSIQGDIEEKLLNKKRLELQIQNTNIPEPTKIKVHKTVPVQYKTGLFGGKYYKDQLVEDERVDTSNVDRAYNRLENLQEQLTKVDKELYLLKKGLGAGGEILEKIQKKEKAMTQIQKDQEKLNDKLFNDLKSLKERMLSDVSFKLNKIIKKITTLKENVLDVSIKKISKDISKITNEKIQSKLDDVIREMERLKEDKQKSELELESNKSRINNVLGSLESIDKDINNLESEINNLLVNRR